MTPIYVFATFSKNALISLIPCFDAAVVPAIILDLIIAFRDPRVSWSQMSTWTETALQTYPYSLL